MLFSCKTDMNEVNRLAQQDEMPLSTMEEVTLIYTEVDSVASRIKYFVTTPVVVEHKGEDVYYQEFEKGIYAELYDAEGNKAGSVRSRYAKNQEKDHLWILRRDVVAYGANGEKLETELLYWDTAKEIIYTDQYAKFTSGTQVIEGHNGFLSDQQLNNPVFYQVTQELEVDQ